MASGFSSAKLRGFTAAFPRRAFGNADRVFFPSQASQDITEKRVTLGIVGRVTHELLGHRCCLLERCHQRKILKPKSYQDMWTPPPLSGGFISSFGLGWTIALDPSGNVQRASKNGGG
jgi:hypothetical protein